jgi:hypothetical protein
MAGAYPAGHEAVPGRLSGDVPDIRRGHYDTTESLDAALFQSTTTPALTAATIAGHADRLRRNAELAIDRADDLERAWLTYSAGLLFALIRAIAAGKCRFSDSDTRQAGRNWLGQRATVDQQPHRRIAEVKFPAGGRSAEQSCGSFAARATRQDAAELIADGIQTLALSGCGRLLPYLERPPWQKRS